MTNRDERTNDNNSSNQTQQQQRIYVGGMDVHRLPVSEVLERLRTKLRETNNSNLPVELEQLHVGSCYFQFTASQPGVLESVQSWFHNVTWKGCKLIVQPALPHYLERLQLERQERVHQQTTTTNALSETTTTRNSHTTTTKRHWKIKRKFQELHAIVDTQPCQVDNWERFGVVRARHRSQQAKLQQQQQQENVNNKRESTTTIQQKKKASYYNRSILLKFDAPQQLPSDDPRVVVVERSNNNNMVASDTDGSDTEPSVVVSSSPDDPTSSASSASANHNATGWYVWSDDDDTEADSPSSSKLEEDLATTTTTTLKQTVDERAVNDSASYDDNHVHSDELEKDSLSASDRSVSSQEEEEQDPTTSHSNALQQQQQERPAVYEWSDDDGGGEQETGADDDLRTAKHAVDSDGSEESMGETQVDLQEEVDSNLALLSKLFPEWSQNDNDKRAAAETKQRTCDKQNVPFSSHSGWGCSGQMLRYDPSNPVASNVYEMHDNGDECTTSLEDDKVMNDNDDDQPNNTALETSNSSDKELAVDSDGEQTELDVYEQGKLEQVFKAGRGEQQEGDGAMEDSNVGGFSFGFDLGTAAVRNDLNEDKQRAPLEASEQVPQSSSPVDTPLTVLDSLPKQANAEKQAPTTADTAFDRVFGDAPTAETLDGYVYCFYHELQDSGAIMRNIQSWRNDPAVKEQWLKERASLTLDWKRKVKAAQAKRKKRARK